MNALRTPLTMLAGVVLAVAVGCPAAHLEGDRFHDDKVEYRLGRPGEGWREVKLETANVAFYNDALRASLMVNSHCDGVGDAPLEGLASDLLMGMSDREILEQKKIPWSKREALESVAAARLDGVPRKLALFVLKKDACVYDIVLDASPEHFDAAFAAYKRVRDGFDVDARRDRG